MRPILVITIQTDGLFSQIKLSLIHPLRWDRKFYTYYEFNDPSITPFLIYYLFGFHLKFVMKFLLSMKLSVQKIQYERLFMIELQRRKEKDEKDTRRG